jgi:hypothetical protein
MTIAAIREVARLKAKAFACLRTSIRLLFRAEDHPR